MNIKIGLKKTSEHFNFTCFGLFFSWNLDQEIWRQNLKKTSISQILEKEADQSDKVSTKLNKISTQLCKISAKLYKYQPNYTKYQPN